jgi:hypothetical protein
MPTGQPIAKRKSRPGLRDIQYLIYSLRRMNDLVFHNTKFEQVGIFGLTLQLACSRRGGWLELTPTRIDQHDRVTTARSYSAAWSQSRELIDRSQCSRKHTSDGDASVTRPGEDALTYRTRCRVASLGERSLASCQQVHKCSRSKPVAKC